jgi:hypothetical protein
LSDKATPELVAVVKGKHAGASEERRKIAADAGRKLA